MSGPTEADTCRKFVVPKLVNAGWDNEPHSIAEQRTFTDGRIIVAGPMTHHGKKKRADYLLRYTRDFPIAVVEAKAEYKTAGAGLQQAKEYAEILGVKGCTAHSAELDAGPYIRESRDFVVVINDGRTWAKNHVTDFQKRFEDPKKTTELFLVDPNGDFTPNLAAKTGYSLDDQKTKVAETVGLLKKLYKGNGQLRIYYLKHYPTHTVFMADKEMILSLYCVSSGYRAVPAFCCETNSSEDCLVKLVNQDIDELRKESQLVFDSKKEPALAEA